MYRGLIALALLTGVSTPAVAGIQIFNNPGAVSPDENVLMDTGLIGTSIIGETNQTSTDVTFVSPTGATLAMVSDGQSRIVQLGGPLDSVRFFLTNGGGFREVEFDLHKAAKDTNNVTVTFFGSFTDGQASRSFSLGNGNNWFSAVTDAGDFITAVLFDTDGSGVDDLRQVRLGGFAAPGPVPEPAVWVSMLSGFFLLGSAVRRRRVQQTVSA